MRLIPLFLFLFSFLAFAEKPQEIRIRITEDLGTLDWNYGEVNSEVVNLLMEGLFRTGKKGETLPAVAATYSWHKNYTLLKVKLKNANWSDGKKVCAEHFVDSWNRLRSKEFASPYAHYAHGLKKFEAPDCNSLQIEFLHSSPEALAYLSHYVFFPWRKDQVANAFSKGDGLLVNGAYQLEKWKRGKSIHLVSRSEKKSSVRFLVVPEDSTAQAMFERGDLDVLKDLPHLVRTEKTKNPKVFPTLVTFYFGINQKKVPDQNLRWALSQSIAREELVKILGVEYQGSTRWVNESLLKSKWKEPEVDWAKAKAAAAKANLVLRVYQKGVNRLLAEWAQGQWEKKLGVRIPIEAQEGKVYWKEITREAAPIFLSGVTAPYAHPKAFLQEFLSSSTANWTEWRSVAYDEAVKSKEFAKAEVILQKSGVVIPLFHRNSALNLSDRAKGVWMNPLGQLILPSLE